MDAKDRIIDFNIAVRVLMGVNIEGCRYHPARHFLQRVHPRMEGDLFPQVIRLSENSNCATNVSAGRDSPKKEVTEANGRYHSEDFGWVDLHRTAISHLDPNTGDVLGATIFWEILRIEQKDAFRDILRKQWSRELMWATYAISYDRVLPQLPFYQEVVHRHVGAMSAPGIIDIIDLGAGTGNVTIALLKAGRRVTAVDLSRAMLDKLRAKLPEEDCNVLTVVEQNAEHLPQWDNESFDGVNILLALFDMTKPMSAFSEAERVLRPGGRLVITEPKRCFDVQTLLDLAEKFLRDQGLYESRSADWDRVTHSNKVLNPSGHSPLWAEDIEKRLCEAGFEDVTMEDSHLGHCATVRGRKPRRT